MNQTLTYPPESFQAFRLQYKSQIRPPETLPRLRRAMGVDARFLAEFEALRVYLRPMLENWPDMILAHLKQFPELLEAITPEAEQELRAALKAHAKKLALGRFDEQYLDTLEDVALFLIRLEVKSVYLAGAYQEMTRKAIDLVFERAEKRHAIRHRQLMQILASALALELNQIQRVYTVYERRRYEDLLEEIRRGGVAEGALEALLPPPELTLDPEDLAVARPTTEALLRQKDLLAGAFFKQLFERSPELRGLFPEELSGAKAAFAEVLETLLTRLEEPRRLGDALHELAENAEALRLPSLRFTPLQRAVGDSLIDVFHRACGLEWTEERETAWRHIYDACLALARDHAMTLEEAA